MSKYVCNAILAFAFLLGSFSAHSQLKDHHTRISAQMAPAWILKAQEPLSNHASHIRSSKGDAAKLQLSPRVHASGQSAFSDINNLPVYKKDEVFIKFKAHVSEKVETYSRSSEISDVISHQGLRTTLNRASVSRLNKLTQSRRFKSLATTYKAVLDAGVDVDQAIDILKTSPEIDYIEKVPEYYTLQAPNDPSYANGRQYALDLIHATEAFALQKNSREIFVAIVDDAFLYDHPDLAGNVDLSKCYDVADDDNDTRPPSSGENKAGPFTFSHGTHVGGIVGAVTNNATGVASVSNNKVKIFGIKATRDDTDEPRNIDDSYEGVLKAIENGADIINMSFGGTGNSQTWQNMINDATADGVIFVAAAGNGNTSAFNYPAAYDNVIAVANTDQRDQKNPSSHYGDWVSIAAPGTNILSTVVADDGASGSYTSLSGTSMASPMVAGLIGLMLSEDNTLDHDQVLDILQSTSDDIDAKNPGFNGKLGAGRINAYNAMLEVSSTNSAPVANFVSSDPKVFVGQAVDFSSQSLGKNLTYSWTFEGGSPAVASGKHVAVVYNQTGTFNISLTVSNGSGSDVVSRSDYVTVVAPQNCALLSFPMAGNRSLYSYVNDTTQKNEGPVIGQNVNGFTKFANLYDYLPGNYISGGLFAIGRLESENPERAIVSFKIWEESSLGTFPGNELASQDVSYADLKITGENQSKTNRASYSEIFFEKPAAVPANGRFYMGFEVYYKNGDTIGFYTNEEGEGNGNESFTLYEGNWLSFTEIEFPANIEMSPVLVGANYLNVNSFVAEGGACIGNSIAFNTDGILQNVAAYEWKFEGGSTATSNEANPVVRYSQAGEFEVELLLTFSGCNEARKKFTKVVKIVDCEAKPQAEFTANRYVIEAGDSIQFLEKAANATGFVWTFEGGEPATSALFDPYVTYNEPGVYKVSLEVSNPLGEISSLTKEAYVEVFERGYCNFYIETALSNVPARSNSTLYYSKGFITGTGFGDLAKAEFFDIPGEAYLDRLEITFGEASTNDNDATVQVAIFDNSGRDDDGNLGAPGEVVAIKTLQIARIAEDIAAGVPTEIDFDNAVPLEGPFYAGILLKLENETDSVAILSTTDDEVAEGTSWELTAERVWVPTSSRWETGGSANPLNISLYVSAFLRIKNQRVDDECNPLHVEEKNQPKLVKVYPNPFTAATTIEYELEVPGEVKLEVFNSVGRRVAILEESIKGKGLHQSVFDASTLPKGLYIYKLQTGHQHFISGRIILR